MFDVDEWLRGLAIIGAMYYLAIITMMVLALLRPDVFPAWMTQ